MYSIECFDEYSSLVKSIVSTVVFSEMSIESFFNDYAAACLGDSEFYGSFDRLSVLGKFELISKFILNTTVEKGKSYYSHLKALIKQRDEYVHNKSSYSSFQGYSAQEIEEIHKLHQSDDFEYAEPLLEKKEINDYLRTGLNSLKAIRDIANYFDEHDSNAHSIARLFHPSGILYSSPKEIQYKTLVLSQLGIKVDNQ